MIITATVTRSATGEVEDVVGEATPRDGCIQLHDFRTLADDLPLVLHPGDALEFVTEVTE